MDNNVTFLIAFLYGFLSFLTPCVLPLIPAYISFITGLSMKELSDTRGAKANLGRVLIDTTFFVIGFTTVFVLLGATATALGKFLNINQGYVRVIGGILIIFFGVYITGILRIGAFEQEKKIHLKTKPSGLVGSFLVGIVFAIGWSPCVGPILGSILAIAASKNTLNQGIILLFIYSAGLAVPFYLTSIAVNSFLKLFKRINKYQAAISIVSGILLIIVGMLILTNRLNSIM